jgi:hypothetical protein
VRSHAKASTAGSTKRRAGSLGRIFRGADAGRGALLDVKGTGAPKSRLLGLPLALLVAVFSLILGVGSASAVAPTIVSTSVSAVTTKTAVLEAQINPEGEATTYRFEYGTADCSTNPCTSTPVGNVGAGSSAVKVTREVAGLKPGTAYHYRVIAGNGSGPAEGPDTTFKTYAAAVADTSCPNQAFRYGPGAFLPDCRAYEMVSPVEKGSEGIRQFSGLVARAGFNQSDLDGDKLAYASAAAFGDQTSARNANQYIATRGPGGWATHGINPPAGRTLGEPLISYSGDFETPFKLFTPDLSAAWVVDYGANPFAPGAVKGWPNLYRRDNFGDDYEALTTSVLAPSEGYPGEKYPGGLLAIVEEFIEVQGHSSDFGHIVFAMSAPLTPAAAVTTWRQLYDFTGGQLHLVSVLPDGTANPEAAHAGTARDKLEHHAWFSNAVSDDGSRIFWSSSPGWGGSSLGEGQIYVRLNPDRPQSALNGSNECTEPAKACTLPVSSGNAQFWTASGDGSTAIYSEGEVADGTATLFERDVDAKTSTQIAAQVSGVLGASEDASRLYFVSREALDGGATAGQPNLYLDQEGTKTFIATLSPEDTGTEPGSQSNDVFPTVDSALSQYHASRVTPDGRHVAFGSSRSLTGYDNADAVNGKPSMEVYLYDADADELLCASCNPTGARPVGKVLQRPYTPSGDNPTPIWAAAWLSTFSHDLFAPRALLDDGSRLFFNSFDSLSPRDSNGAQDVYQWEAQGTGTCQSAGGCISLVSTGEDPSKSEFVDASVDGSNVFIETDAGIAPQDPGLTDIYDVREGGGYPPPPVPPTPCIGDACQSIPAPPNDPTPASAAFSGAGDPPAQKQRRRCRAQNRHVGKKAKRHSKRRQAKRCRGAKRSAAR